MINGLRKVVTKRSCQWLAKSLIQLTQNNCELRWPLQVDTWKGGEDRKPIAHEEREHNSFLVLYDVKTGLGCTSIASIPGTWKSSFTCRKILRHGTFPLYFPSERKVCCGFLSPLKIHRLGRNLSPQPLGPVANTLTTIPPSRQNLCK
jgi:hypothetical protein